MTGDDRLGGMMPAAWVEGFKSEEAKWRDPAPWLAELRHTLAAIAHDYRIASTHYEQLIAAQEAVRALLPALDELKVEKEARQLFVRIALSINMMSIGQQGDLLRPLVTRGGRGAGRERELVQCGIVFASVARREHGERQGIADQEVAKYAARRNLKGHRGKLIKTSTVEEWRLATYAGKLPAVRTYVELRLSLLKPLHLNLSEVNRITEREIDFLVSQIVTKIPD